MIAGLYLAQSVSVGVLCRQHQPGDLADVAGRFQDVVYRLGIEGADRTMAATGPHSTLTLTDKAEITHHNSKKTSIRRWASI